MKKNERRDRVHKKKNMENRTKFILGKTSLTTVCLLDMTACIGDNYIGLTTNQDHSAQEETTDLVEALKGR